MTPNGTELGAQEWRDSLFLRYGIEPLYLPSHCDGFGAAYTIYQALDFNNSGLVMARHNNLHDGIADLSGKAFIPAHVRDNPKIFIGRAVRGGGGASPREKLHQRGRRHRLRRSGRKRGACLSGIFGLKRQIAFTTYVLRILTPSPTSPRTCRSAWRPQSRKRSGSISKLA